MRTKTTLHIDETVMASLRREAARTGRTMSELVETALRQPLRRRVGVPDLSPLVCFDAGGPVVDVADRDELHRVMEGRQVLAVDTNVLVHAADIRARFDARSGALLGAPEPRGRNERFADTPGWSNRTSWDGGIICARRPPRPDPTFIRVMPRIVDSMKAAVDAATR